MYYMVETLRNCGYRCRQAVKLNAESLRDARKEAIKRQFFQGTILYIGTEIDKIGFMASAEVMHNGQRWTRVPSGCGML